MAQQDFSLLLNLAPDAAPAATDADSFVSTIGSALENRESGGKQLRPDGTPVTSKKGAIGKWQVMPGTAPEAAKLAGVEFDDTKYRTDGEYNSLLGKAYLKKQYETYEDPAKALAAYNAGPGAVDSAIARAEKAGNPSAWLRYLPAETQAYVPAIMGRAGRTQQQEVGSYSNARPLVKDRTTGEAVADVALGAGAGVVQGVGMLAGAFGADNPVARGADAVAKTLTDSQSQYRKDQRTERSFAIKDAEASGSTWNEIVANAGAFAEAPVETTLNALGTSAPTILMGVIPGLGQAGAARLIMQGAMGAAQGAGAAKGSIYEAVMQKLIDQGESPDVAAKVAAGAQAYDGQNGGNIAASALIGAVAGTSGVESAAARLAGKKAGQETTRGIAGRAAMGVVKEAPVEGFQGGQERYTSNVALQNEGFDVPTFQGVAGQAAGEALASAPGGAAFGALDRGMPAAPKAPPALQPVIDKAKEGNSPLSKAAVAGNAGVIAQAAAAATTPDNTGIAPTLTAAPAAPAAEQKQLPATDAMGERVRQIESEFRGSGLLDTLREDGVNAAQVFDDLNAARSLNAPLEVRQEALSAVEELLAWAKQNKRPAEPMDNIETPAAMERSVAPAVNNEAPSVDAVVAALRDDQISRLISDADRENISRLLGDAGNKQLPMRTRQEAAAEAKGIVGRYQAPQGQASGQTTPALATPAASLTQTPENKAAPVGQQFVNPATGAIQESDFLTDVDAPSVKIPEGKTPAFIRKRAAEIKQLVEMGFESVERNGSEFLLINSKTGQRFKLTGMADSQLARKAIKDHVDAKAHTAATSPKNDLKIPGPRATAADRYKKGDILDLNGVKIKIENPEGSTRTGTSPDGVVWESTMVHHYGDIERTSGADGDKVDVFIGPRPDTNKIFVIDQLKQDGSFDEHKVMMGFTSEEAAREGYLANYEKGWTGLGAITEMGVDEFKSWVKSPAAKKPVADTQDKPAAKVAEKAAAAPEKAVDLEEKPDAANDAPPTSFSTYAEAKSYIVAQRRNGSDLSALPYPNEDGTFGIAVKGTPGYTKAEKYAADQQKKAKKAKKPAAKKGESFTIKDGDKNVELQKVAKSDLPNESSSIARGGNERQLTQSDASLLERLASALGKQIQIFSGDGGDGFVRPDDPGTIYINESTSINPLAIFGHELFHQIKRENPQAWKSIAKVVKANISQAAYDQMVEVGYKKSQALEEIVSDLGGDFLSDGAFWRDVFAQIEADHGKDAKGIIAKLVAYLNNLVEQLINDIKQPGFNAASLVKDVRAVRAAYKEGITQYLKDSSLTRPALQAQILREEQGVKKSLARAGDPQAQYDAVVAKYKDTAEWLKAPNGSDSNLSERQWVQVRTPAFKKWFGDWEKFAKLPGGVWNDDKGAVSKVVDNNGEPMVVYHGSSKGGFSEFKTPGGTKRGDLGIFTTPNLEMAKSYVSRRGGEIQYADMEPEAIEGGDQPGYYANFVNIRNPLESDFEGAHWNGERPGRYQVMNQDGELQRDQNGKAYFDMFDDANEFAKTVEDGEVQPADEHYETTDSVVREARSDDNDGAIIRNVVDSGSGAYTNYIDEASDVFVALDPSQIKSATQNTGEFGTGTADMRFSRKRDQIKQANEFAKENGILPYVSSGAQAVPVSIQKSIKREGKYGNHPVLGIPVNANGTVTLYYPTTNADARRIVRERSLKGTGERVYLTNESGVANVMAKRGNIEQKIDGANVLLQINPDLLQIDTEHEDGRKDFFVQITEGSEFRKKMSQVKLFTQNAPRDKGLSEKTTINDITSGITDAIEEMAGLNFAGRRARVKEARLALKAKHNVGTLLSVNGKLEKTNVGGYGLDYDGKDVMSMGLGLASAQKINDEQKLTTCPQSAICQSLCLGETSGQNLLYGGEGQFKSGPRMSQYLKTEAMVQSPEDFATVLFAEIDRFARNAKRDDYQATVRLNVTSDFPPKVFEALIKAFPDVMFYDYTKLNNKVIAENHHLTYSSTGASQIVDGKTIVNPESNWDAMVTKLNRGSNVAMAFTDKNEMPAFVIDGKTGQKFQVWNGDNYDARFLDPKREDGIGMIVGLTNKDRTTKPEEAAVKHKGFFVDYNPARDGDTVVIQDQEALASGKKVIPIKVMKFSRKRNLGENFERWSRGAPLIELGDPHDFMPGEPVVVEALHGSTNADITEFKRSRANVESDWGAGFYASNTPEDVATNYANVNGPDLTARIERETERLADSMEFDDELASTLISEYLKDTGSKEKVTEDTLDDLKEEYVGVAADHAARKRHSEGAPNTMKLFMRMLNPVVIGNNETRLDYSEEYNEETDDYEEPTGKLVEFTGAIRDIAPDYGVRDEDIETAIGKIFEQGIDGDMKVSDVSNIIKQDFVDAFDDDGNSASHEIVRRALSDIGFDGIIDTTVSEKFGPKVVRNGQTYDRTGGMKGMSEDTVHFIAFEPTQIKSATGNDGGFDPTDPDIRKSRKRDEKSESKFPNTPEFSRFRRPEFYSQLQRAIEGVPERLATMSAPAWKQWIEANAAKLGVKKDEVEWSGIKDYLDLQGKAKLAKGDVAAYLAESGVNVQDVMKGDIKNFDAMSDEQLRKEYARIRGYEAEAYGEPMDREEILDELEGMLDEDGDDTKYGKYVLPGGENYRELLITLPTKNTVAGISPAQAARVLYNKEYANLTPEQQADVKRRIADEDSSPAYMSSHWSEANILAHIRVNDRTDADGNRVLFVEEVQSDWGQEGLKSGFAESMGDMPNMSADELLRKHEHSMTESQREYLQDFSERWDNADSDEEIDDLTNEYQQWIPQQRLKGLPKAPFITKTEGWLNLALKRIAMMAVDGGYDKVAFVNGQQSADRYDMAKQVDAIRVNLNPDGTYQLGVQPIGMRMQRHDTSVPANKLSDMIGKELAEKAIAEVTEAGVDGGKVYSGLDLKVGGEGMTKFYDQILPQNLSKLLPKLGGEKAGAVDAGNAAEIERIALTAKIRNLPFESKERAALTKELHALEQGYSPLEQLGFDVTDKMRETVSGGVPLFSRARKPWFEDINSIKLASGYQVGDFITSSKKVTWWDKSVGTMYNLAEKHPEFKRVFDAVQRFIDDVSVYANKAADLAPNILPKLESWKDIAKTPMSAEDVAALRDPIFQGTLSFSRDENGDLQPEDDVEKAGVVFSNQELRDYFQLDDRQIALYREFRAAVNQSITTLNASDMLRYLGEDGDAIRDQVMAAKTVKQSERIISAHLDLLIEQQPGRAEVLTNTKEVISEKVGQAIGLMARGYAPLSRYGEFTVYVVGKDGEQQYFSMFESQAEANKMAREMREQYPDSEVTTGTMSKESYKLFSGVTPESLALFGEALGLEENGVDEKSQAYQQYLKLAKSNRSAMKRLIQRKGIDGFSEDAGRVLAGFVYSNARQVSTNLHAGEIGKAAAAVKSGDLKDMAIKLMNYIQNPQEEAQAIRGLMFAQFIGGSIASALVNMTQPFTMTMPYLSQFVGATGAAARMADAVKLVSKGIKDDDELAKALKRAEADGVVSPQEVHQLMAQSQGKGALKSGDGTKSGDALAKANNTLAKISLGWGKLFGTAEQFNRRVTFIAAYKVARDQKMADPFAFAENAIRETQGVYNKGNKPAWARGAVGATLFTFKQYSIAYVEFLQRMWGNGPEGKKAVGMALLVLFAVSGLGGMPGADDLDDVIDGIAQRVFNKSFDSKQAKKEFLSGFVGDGFADFLMGGITSIPGSPIDLSGRMGLGNLVPGTGFFTKKSSYTRDLAEIGGPAFSMAANWLVAGGQVAQGDIAKAAKTVSPQAAQNLIKASDMWTMGMYRDEKGRKVVDVDAWEGVVKAIGFQPASVKKIQEATSTQQNLIGQNKLRETEIADLWTAGRVERDQDKIAKAKEQIAQWNKDNPQSKIEIDPKQIDKRVQKANQSKAQRIAATAPKEIRGSVTKELDYLNR